MEHVKLGSTGARVSRIILGCMSYGDPALGNHAWSLGLDESRPFFQQAIEAGIELPGQRVDQHHAEAPCEISIEAGGQANALVLYDHCEFAVVG